MLQIPPLISRKWNKLFIQIPLPSFFPKCISQVSPPCNRASCIIPSIFTLPNEFITPPALSAHKRIDSIPESFWKRRAITLTFEAGLFDRWIVLRRHCSPKIHFAPLAFIHSGDFYLASRGMIRYRSQRFSRPGNGRARSFRGYFLRRS